MIETLEKPAPFTERVAAALAPPRADDAFAELRTRAAETFGRLGLPTRKDEAWKYTNVRRLLERTDFALLEPGEGSRLTREDAERFRIPGLEAHLLVVVNGALRPDLSDEGALPEGLRAESLREALASEPAAAHFGRYAVPEAGAFVALNTAFELDGLFVHVAPNATLERPLQVAHVTDAAHDALVQTRNLYLFGQNSEALLVETFHSAGEARTFANSVTEIVVERDARAHVLKLQDEHEAAAHVNTVHAVQTGTSTFAHHTYTFGGALVRNTVTIVPDAEHCESHLYGLYLIDGEQHVDNHTLLDHTQPGCNSNELYRGILDGRSTGIFNGKVFVHQAAQQTNAYQSSQGVLLDDGATLYSKPELEIYADDVKCSHGSTTGELEPEHVFYLRSRGLSERQAKALLLYAFAHDIVEQLPDIPALRDHLDGLIDQKLNL